MDIRLSDIKTAPKPKLLSIGFIISSWMKDDMKFQRSKTVFHAKYASQTRRDILYFLKFSTRHDRGGQEEGRATNQQSIHCVRPWNSHFSIEAYSKEWTLWKFYRITKKLQRARDYLNSAKKHNCGTIMERCFQL